MLLEVLLDDPGVDIVDVSGAESCLILLLLLRETAVGETNGQTAELSIANADVHQPCTAGADGAAHLCVGGLGGGLLGVEPPAGVESLDLAPWTRMLLLTRILVVVAAVSLALPGILVHGVHVGKGEGVGVGGVTGS